MDTVSLPKRRKNVGATNAQTEEHDRHMLVATAAYSEGRWRDTIIAVRHAIQVLPSADAYELLYVLFRERGQHERAMEFRLLQAHMSVRNVALWEELLSYYLADSTDGTIAPNHPNFLKVIYVLGRIRSFVEDVDAAMEMDLQRASMLVQAGEGNRAISLYHRVLRENDGLNIEATTQLALLYYHLGNAPRALMLLSRWLGNVGPACDLSHVFYVAGMRAEIQTETGKYSEAVDGLQEVAAQFHVPLETTLPLLSKYITALVLQSDAEDAPTFERTYSEKIQMCLAKVHDAVETYFDMLFDTAVAVMRVAFYHIAGVILVALNEVRPNFLPVLYQLSQLAYHTRDSNALLLHTSALLRQEPAHVDTHVLLSKYFLNIVHPPDVTSAVRHLTDQPDTDAVLRLRLCVERAKLFLSRSVWHETDIPLNGQRDLLRPFYAVYLKEQEDRSKGCAPAGTSGACGSAEPINTLSIDDIPTVDEVLPLLAIVELRRIFKVVLCDPPEESVAEGPRQRPRRGASATASLYASSTLTMSSSVGVLGSAASATPAESVASTFRWESRPAQRTSSQRTQRFDTSAVRSSATSSVARGDSGLEQQQSLFQFYRQGASKRAREEAQQRAAPPSTQPVRSTMNNKTATAAVVNSNNHDVANMDDLDEMETFYANEAQLSPQGDELADESGVDDPEFSLLATSTKEGQRSLFEGALRELDAPPTQEHLRVGANLNLGPTSLCFTDAMIALESESNLMLCCDMLRSAYATKQQDHTTSTSMSAADLGDVTYYLSELLSTRPMRLKARRNRVIVRMWLLQYYVRAKAYSRAAQLILHLVGGDATAKLQHQSVHSTNTSVWNALVRLCSELNMPSVMATIRRRIIVEEKQIAEGRPDAPKSFALLPMLYLCAHDSLLNVLRTKEAIALLRRVLAILEEQVSEDDDDDNNNKDFEMSRRSSMAHSWLCLALCYANLCRSRTTASHERHGILVKMVACLDEYKGARTNHGVGGSNGGSALLLYLRERLCEAEVQYNTGRALHHIGIVYAATPLYDSCLQTLENVKALARQLTTTPQHHDTHDNLPQAQPPQHHDTAAAIEALKVQVDNLMFGAAHNLHHIYCRTTGNHVLARSILKRYIVI
eukprot:PhM_4_TR10275/c0_g2_i1/m.97206